MELKRTEIAVNRMELKRHCNSLRHALKDMDVIMKMKESNERGKYIAKVMNRIDMARQTCEHFMLGIDLKKLSYGKPIK